MWRAWWYTSWWEGRRFSTCWTQRPHDFQRWWSSAGDSRLVEVVLAIGLEYPRTPGSPHFDKGEVTRLKQGKIRKTDRLIVDEKFDDSPASLDVGNCASVVGVPLEAEAKERAGHLPDVLRPMGVQRFESDGQWSSPQWGAVAPDPEALLIAAHFGLDSFEQDGSRLQRHDDRVGRGGVEAYDLGNVPEGRHA